jgi:hypothetical protein
MIFCAIYKPRYGTEHNAAHAARLEEAAQWIGRGCDLRHPQLVQSHAAAARLRQPKLFDQKRLDDAPALKLKLVKDYWREFVYPLEGQQLGALKALGATPDALLKNIQSHWQKSENRQVVFPKCRKTPILKPP